MCPNLAFHIIDNWAIISYHAYIYIYIYKYIYMYDRLHILIIQDGVQLYGLTGLIVYSMSACTPLESEIVDRT